jgi:predicted RNase H-like HicB family nuclease
MDQYSIVCQWSDEDEGYIALVPELKGVSAFGKTPAEAIKELEIAKELYLDVFKEDDCELPEPRKLSEFSGQLRIRLPKSLHEELSRAAESDGSSLNTYIIHLLSSNNQLAKVEKKLIQIKNSIYDTILSGSIQKGIVSSSETQTISARMDDPGSIPYSCNQGETTH